MGNSNNPSYSIEKGKMEKLKIYEIRNGDSKQNIRCEKIAHVSSELPSKDRHTEFVFYVSEHGEWVLQGVGVSRVPGEVNKYWSVLSNDAMDVINAVVGNDVSRLAKQLLVGIMEGLANCD